MTDSLAAAKLDEAVMALSEASVALVSIAAHLRLVGIPDVKLLAEDGMDAASRARRLLVEVREQLPVEGYSVKVEP